MRELKSDDLFDALKNAQDAGILELLPSMHGRIAPGDRFFESFQAHLLQTYDFDLLDRVLSGLAPTIHFLADPAHWEPQDYTAEELFDAVWYLKELSFFELIGNKLTLPGSGDRFFEHYQRILLDEIGLECMDRTLHKLGQGIRFLAAEATVEKEREGKS